MDINYETVCIVRPDVPEESVKGIIQKATATLETGGGKLKKLDEWGRRRLAYSIQKKNEGYYFIIDYSSKPDVSREIGRILSLNEDVLRYQTIRVEEPSVKVRKTKKAVSGKGGANGKA